MPQAERSFRVGPGCFLDKAARVLLSDPLLSQLAGPLNCELLDVLNRKVEIMSDLDRYATPLHKSPYGKLILPDFCNFVLPAIARSNP